MSDQPTRLVATGSQTVGPFFHHGLTTKPELGVLACPDTPGERIELRVRVTDGNGDPVQDCMVEIWQADAEGSYVEETGSASEVQARPARRFSGFGRLPTDKDGACRFVTIRPGPVDDGRGGRQAAHLHVRLFMRGLLRHIDTRVYFAGDSALADDAVLALVPAGRRATLLALPSASTPRLWLFDVRLQGEKETVFFDL